MPQIDVKRVALFNAEKIFFVGGRSILTNHRESIWIYKVVIIKVFGLLVEIFSMGQKGRLEVFHVLRQLVLLSLLSILLGFRHLLAVVSHLVLILS